MPKPLLGLPAARWPSSMRRASIYCVVGDRGIGLNLHIRISQTEDVGQSCEARARHSLKINSPTGRYGILRDDAADLESVCTGQADGKRNRGIGLNGIQKIGATASPTG